MKFGYSNLLGELIPAEKSAHKDCEFFQIVCPKCREPIFKVERPSDDKLLHYFAHYQAQLSHADDCEMRVGRFGHDDIAHRNSVSRDQKIRLFIGVLRGSVARLYAGRADMSAWKRYVRKLESRLWTRRLADVLLCVVGLDDRPRFDLVAEDVHRDRGRPQTTFADAVQRRIAHDMLLHVLSPGCAASRLYLVSVALVELEQRLKEAGGEGAPQMTTRMLSGLMKVFLHGHGPGALRVLAAAELLTIPGHLGSISLDKKFVAEVMQEICGVLLALPYFEILREQMDRRVSRAMESVVQ